jgi:hypothetical protein
LVVKIKHSGSGANAQIWVKIHDGAKGWSNGGQFQCRLFLLHTSLNIYNFGFGEEDVIPRIGDIWVPRSCYSPNHFICFFILGIEHLLQVGDKFYKLTKRGLSRLINWRLCQKLDQELKWQLESFDEQSYLFKFYIH